MHSYIFFALVALAAARPQVDGGPALERRSTSTASTSQLYNDAVLNDAVPVVEGVQTLGEDGSTIGMVRKRVEDAAEQRINYDVEHNAGTTLEEPDLLPISSNPVKRGEFDPESPKFSAPIAELPREAKNTFTTSPHPSSTTHSHRLKPPVLHREPYHRDIRGLLPYQRRENGAAATALAHLRRAEGVQNTVLARPAATPLVERRLRM